MRQSQLFTKVHKQTPKDEVSKNAQLLIRAGFVHKEMAGVYSFLPLGLRVLNNINNIIREEMNAIGGQELFLSALQEKKLWEMTDRFGDDKVDVWFKTALKNGTELGLGFTHEEPITAMMKQHVHSYKDLPRYAYQIQTKFRNETRAKSGIMRGREFLMKDLYSFSTTQVQHDEFYEKSKIAYHNVFRRCGLGDSTYTTFASGGVFSKYSHEFQTISDAGEDTIFVDEEKKIAVNEEVYTDEVLEQLGLDKSKMVEKKSIEVGNIFTLGTRFSEPLGLQFTDELGNVQPVFMGSYGIGPSRVMGTIAEVFADDNGLVWPESVAPFRVHLVSLLNEDTSAADKLYEDLTKAGVEVLYDDRDARAGEKFAASDLMGIPNRVVVSKKTLEQGSVELKKRTDADASFVSLTEIVNRLSQPE
jgi:prolyl-tRNA synthetase